MSETKIQVRFELKRRKVYDGSFTPIESEKNSTVQQKNVLGN
jgi:hypothetical protein